MSARDDAEVLFANERFYTAFAEGDSEAMEDLWAKQGAVCCLHPGWEPLHDRAQVIASWNAILQSPPPVLCAAPRVLPMGPDGAGVVCWEAIGQDYLIATNLFRREAGVWRIVHHQAGPVRGAPPKQDTDEAGRKIN